MRRHLALRNLSVDHHHALVQAHRLQKAEAADDAARGRLVQDFLNFWLTQAQPHFVEEEQALLPYCARYMDLNQEPIVRMLVDHAVIRRDAALLAESNLAPAELAALGSRLEAHVRLEERIVFPLLEDSLPATALDGLEAMLLAWRDQHPH